MPVEWLTAHGETILKLLCDQESMVRVSTLKLLKEAQMPAEWLTAHGDTVLPLLYCDRDQM
eukprot:39766-Amphidinium_carterae.1